MTEPRWTLASAPLMNDAELIERVLAGERDFFRAIVQRYHDTLFRVAYTIVRDEDTAADMVQDAFIRAYTNLARCRDRHRFRVWLLATVRHRALDHLRERRRADVSLSKESVRFEAERRAAASGSDGAEQFALRCELDVALTRLSAPLREAFVLRHVEHLSYEDTAAVLGIGVSAAKMRVQRARRQLMDWLDSDVTGGAVRTSSEQEPPLEMATGNQE
jgi:RNA polymerase sigma-70 factor (ECF subfamily)